LARLAARVFCSEADIEARLLRLVLHDVLKERKLLTAGARLRIEFIMRGLQAEYQGLFDQQEPRRLLATATLQLLLRPYAHPLEAGHRLPPILTLILVDWLVGDWSAFLQRYTWMRTMSTGLGLS
jgi:hypothetical protein